MIGTGIDKRIQVQQIIEHQLPEFITTESPLAVDFLKQYYISQEHRGGVIDLSDNLDQYIKLDNLTPEVIVGVTTLTTGITSADTTINVSSTKGFPNEYGLFKIDDEIFTYTGITTNSFTGCVRGFSGITSYTDPVNRGELVFSTSIAGIHTATSNVQNLSVLFLKEFYQKVKSYITPGLEDTKLSDKIDVSNFIKESKSLYKSKGTEESFRILFNVLYGITPKIVDLENFLIKPSSAEYIRREVVVAEQISGDPNKLIGQTITKSTDLTTSGSVSEVEIFSRTGNLGITTYYKLNLFVGYDERSAIQGTFTIPGKTRVIEDAPVGSTILTVDSTVGFGTTGTVVTNGITGVNTITYGDKSINQFLLCTGIGNSIRSTDDLRSDEFIFGYEDGDLEKRVELRITGVLSNFELLPSEGTSVTLEGEKITVKNLGEKIPNPTLLSDKTRKTVFFNSWIYNTASRIKLDFQSTTAIGTRSSDLVQRSVIDKSQLVSGDKVSLFRRGEVIPIKTGIAATVSLQTVGLALDSNNSPLNDGITQYDIQRELKKAYAATDIDLQFGNNVITTDVQNTYNEQDENYYVASSSMPSYEIEKKVIKETIGGSSSPIISDPLGIGTGNLRSKSLVTGLYSQIHFTTKSEVDFRTGDAISYIPSGIPLVGLDTSGVYYVERLTAPNGAKNVLRLYPSRSFITVTNVDASNPPYVEFSDVDSNGVKVINDADTHRFVLLRHKNEQIGVQKVLKKFPAQVNIKSGKSVKTEAGTTGILKNGVEIANYKSLDKIYFGPLSEFKILNQGKGFDVINLPTVSIPSPGTGTTALVQPVVSGVLDEVLVDQQHFDVEKVMSVTISGGNGSGAVLKPVVTKRTREISFEGRLKNVRGGVDQINNLIEFKRPHNLENGEPLVYNNNGNPSLGIGTFNGSSTAQNRTLVNGATYYPQVVGISSVYLYEKLDDYKAGINTVGFTVENTNGEHKFTFLNLKNHLKSVRVINPGTNYTNRRLIVKPVGIHTVDNSINFKNHGFVTGDLVQYAPSSGDANHAPVGLGVTTRYRVLKLDDDKFRLIDVGIGATDPTQNYLRKNFKRISEVSTSSNHEFFFEPIVVNVNAIYSPVSAGRTESLIITPKIRGKLVDGYLYESGTNYGSSILNFEKKPNIKILNGTGAELKAIVLGGKLIGCDVMFGGKDYTSAPDLDLVGIGTGIGGKLRAIVTDGRVTEVRVINPGIGYTTVPDVKVTSNGSGFILDSAVRNLSVNNLVRFGDEILLREAETNLQYSVVGYSNKIQSTFNDLATSPQLHSPVIGWAYDGNPIYGPYGYSEVDNNNSLARVLRSGYDLDTSKVINRPNLSEFAAGFFVEDYTFTNSGDLDESNGRYCKTPDFPNGTYAYFAGISTITADPVFPYFIGDTYRSDPVNDNFVISQDIFDFNASDLNRNTLPYKLDDDNADYNFVIESYEINPLTSIIESVTSGNLKDFQIVSAGENFKVGDSLNFDNSGTEGGGAAAQVSRVLGKDLHDVKVGVTTFNDVVFTRSGNGSVSGYISTNHTLTTSDIVVISGLTTSIPNLTGSHKIGVSSETTVLYKELPANSNSGIVTDIYLARIPRSVSVGSSIGIGTERLRVLNIFDDRSILRVKRGVVGSANTASHVLGGLVETIPQIINLESEDIGEFVSKRDNKIFFNPQEQIGIALTVGEPVSLGKSFTLGERSTVIEVPARGIFIPNHPFTNNQQLTFTIPSGAGEVVCGTAATTIVPFTNTVHVRNGVGIVTIQSPDLAQIGDRLEIQSEYYNVINNTVVSGRPTLTISPIYSGSTNATLAASNVKRHTPIRTNSANFNLSAVNVFAQKISDNIIGITTEKDGDLVFFKSAPTDSFEYSLESNFEQVKGKVERITVNVGVATVSVGSTLHGLQNNDNVKIKLKSTQTKGVGAGATSVVVKYSAQNDKLLINPTIFTNSSVKTNNTINIPNHGFKTGQKLFYDGDSATGLSSQRSYFVYKVDDSNFKLSLTRYDVMNEPPLVETFTANSGGTQELSLVNPPLEIVRNDNLLFYVSDPSLNGYNFNFYFDDHFNNKFVSAGSTVNFSVESVGTVGVGTTSTITLKFNETNPQKLYYTLEKTGFISTSDPDVKNASQISYIDSEYNGDYVAFGVTTGGFKISLNDVPEESSYTVGTSSTITYETSSKNTTGGISKINLTSSGFGYKNVPSVSSVTSVNGTGANILCLSDNINKINQVRITDPGYDFHSDKTLQPEARLSPTITLINSDSITDIQITSGGAKYTDEPDLVIIDPDTGKLTGDQGVINVKLSSSSLGSVEILESPRGLTSKPQILRTINNTNGFKVTKVESSNSGIVTCTLKTPINGFAVPQFTAGEQIFVENIGIGTTGNGFNSADNGFVFFNVVEYNNTDPAILKFELPETATNPGVAASDQSFASIIKYEDYPRFSLTQKSSEFRTGEKLAVKINNAFVSTGLIVIDNRPDEFIKLEGRYEVFVGDIIRGENSGTVATINSIVANKGRFKIDYSLRQNKGWNDEIGRLSEDFMVLSDNNYYQNLSYTIQSPKTFNQIIDPVNRLLHTSGLKNFADTGITSTTSVGISSSNVTVVSADVISEERVDAVNNFDLGRDINTIENGSKSKFIQLINTKLANFVQCNTNRVLKIDDISPQFSDSEANLTGNIKVPFDETFVRFIVQSRNISSGEIQVDEVVIFSDSTDTFTFEKNSLVSTASTIVEVEGQGNNLVISPLDPNNDDIDIKVYKNSFNDLSLRSGTQNIGFVNLVGISTVVGVGSTAEPIAFGSTTSVDAFYATIEVQNTVSGEKNHVDIYATHDGTNSYYSEYYADTSSQGNFSSNFIGTFRSRIHNNVLSLDFDNSVGVTTDIKINAKVIGFNTTGGNDVFRFKDDAQPDGAERTVNLRSGITTRTNTANFISLDKNDFSAVKSIVRIESATASAVHQVLAIHDGTDTHTIHYPFISIGSTSGIGTFSSNLTASNFVVKFHPDSGTGSHTVQHFSEEIYRDIDILNTPPTLGYGRVNESVSAFQYNAVNGIRSNKKNFILRHNTTPIYEKGFDPEDTSKLNRSTGIFTIPNHFFSDNEQLIYSPVSTFAGVGATALQMTGGSNLPSTVFVKKLTNSTFQLATTSGGSAVTFTNVGAGNSHRLTMSKRTEKSIIVIDGIIQSPMAFTPVTSTLVNNAGSGISTTTTDFCVDTTADINLGDHIKFNDEFMLVTAVGIATTSTGPVSGIGTFNILGVDRAALGTNSASHNNNTTGRVFSGSFNIIGSEIFFTNAPRGTNNIDRNLSNLKTPRSVFQGRTYLRKTYTNNRIFDDLSTEFTGIGATFRMKVGGANTTGITTGSSLVLINGIFQKPTTPNNLSNNYEFVGVGTTAQDIEFTGVTSFTTNTQIISESDINQNRLPRGGIVVSLASTGGLGVAPLVGAAVTGVLNQFGGITAVGIGSTMYNASVSPSRPASGLTFGSGYRPVGGTVAIGITDLAYVHRFVSAGVGSIRTNATGSNIFAATQKTATDASYISHTGLLTLTIANHGLSVGNFVGIDTGSLVFTCSRDDFQSNHAYPRALSKTTGLPDPIAGIATVITAVTTNTITAFIGFGGGAGTGASATGNIGVGGTLDINIGAAGTNYVNPRFEFPQPTYENMEIEGVSRNGISTTDTGSNLLVTLNVGSSSTVGIGSTLFEITSFDIARNGYSFKRGDKFKPVGLVTARGADLEDYILEVTEIFNDKFSSWDFGEFDYIDPIVNLQDGVRKRFPLRVNGELLSFDIGGGTDSQLIDMNSLLIIYVNNVLQDPGEAYNFDGGTTFEFTTAPEANDEIAVFFYKGTASEDVSEVNVFETIKDGDVVKLRSNNDTSNLTSQGTRLLRDLEQGKRTVSGITTTDTLETEIYTGVGINDSATNKPLTWIKQKEDKFVNGIFVSKSRDSIEPLVYPTARIIGDIGSGSTSKIYVDDANFFRYEANEDSNVNSVNFDGLIVNETNQVSASFTATVSTAGTISQISVANGGSGYVGNSTSVHISQPPVAMKVSGIATGIGSTAVATATITNGSISSVTINSGGIGYSTSITPKVIAFAHKPHTELIESIDSSSNDYAGFSGIVTGISTITIGSTMGLRFGLKTPGNNFSTLKETMPIYIYNTPVGHGVTSLDQSGADADVVAIGRTFVDNVYMIKNINRHTGAAEIEVNVHSGINTNGIDLAKSNLPFTITFGSVGSGNTSYIGSGKHRGEFNTQPTLSSVHNPTLYVQDGDILSIANSTGGHTFTIKETLGGSNYTTNVSGSGANGSTLVFNTVGLGGKRFYYQCTNHPNAMYGEIYVKYNELGKFSFGVLTPSSGNFVRNNPIAITVTGNTVISGEGLGISTFPTIQRRKFGQRNTGAIRKAHTP